MKRTEHLTTIDEVRSYLADVLVRSGQYPPETRYQLGYYAALEEVARMLDPEGYDNRRSWWLPRLPKKGPYAG